MIEHPWASQSRSHYIYILSILYDAVISLYQAVVVFQLLLHCLVWHIIIGCALLITVTSYVYTRVLTMFSTCPHVLPFSAPTSDSRSCSTPESCRARSPRLQSVRVTAALAEDIILKIGCNKIIPVVCLLPFYSLVNHTPYVRGVVYETTLNSL